MATFPLLADPESYRACEWDLLVHADARDYWIRLFRDHFTTLRAAALESGYSEVQCETLRRELNAALDALVVDGEPTVDRLDILTLDALRTGALRRAGIDDAFAAVKLRETAAALKLLPERLAAVDAMPREQRPVELARGVLGGNIFDLGAVAVAKDYLGGASVGFEQALANVRARPWLVDDADLLRFDGFAKAVVFVDNAGPDVTLGMLPLVRELVRDGARVLVAANSEPALNDITIAELEELLGHVAALDPIIADALGAGTLEPIGTGTGAPLIDLTEVSPDFAERTAGVDLVVLEGMGRALESNYSARFTCASWKVGTIKDSDVARRFGGDMYDCVCRVEPPA